MLDFRGADAEGEAAKRTVRAGVRVAANNRHPGQRRAVFRPDHVHDALARITERKIRLGAAVFAHVAVERVELDARCRILDATVPILGRCVVIGGGDDRAYPPWPAPGKPEPLERLRARHLVHQVTIDVQQRGAVGLGANDVAVPQLVVEGKRGHRHGLATPKGGGETRKVSRKRAAAQ